METINATHRAQRDIFIGFLNRQARASREVVQSLAPIITDVLNSIFSEFTFSDDQREDYIQQVWVKLSEVTPEAFAKVDAPLYTFVRFKMLEAKRDWMKNNGVRKIPKANASELAKDHLYLPFEDLDDVSDGGRGKDKSEKVVEIDMLLSKANSKLKETLSLVAYEGKSSLEATKIVDFERTAYYRELRKFRAKILLKAA